jgi:hypothetical protein
MVLMPALMTVSCCIVILRCFPREGDEKAKQQLVIFGTITGYLSWWTATWWSIYASMGVLFFRVQHQGLRE